MKKIISKSLCLFLSLALLLTGFSVTVLGAEPEDTVYGDADKSGDVTLVDAILIQKYALAAISGDKIDLTASEVSGEGDVTLLDACLVHKHSLGMIDKFPVENGSDTVQLTFNVTIPEAIPDGANISIGTNLNSWNPGDTEWFMDKIDDLHYQFIIALDAQYVGETVEYKYTIQMDGQDNVWSQVEGGPTGGEISNRTFIIGSEGNIVNDTVAMFKNQTGMNTVTGGTLESFKLEMPQYSDGRTRNIRVWVPDGYDPDNTEKRYPVLYMHDGQNVFDSYTSFAGEWQVDEAITDMMGQGYEGAIVVGIDNSGDRINEYTPDWPNVDTDTADNPSGDKYAAFIVETLKPYIDSHYNVRTDKESTCIGGSSMGGLISYYIGLEYPDIFGRVLVFSPSFWLFSEDTIRNEIFSKDFSDTEGLPKIYLYVGGEPSISSYIGFVKDTMVEAGYAEERINTFTDPSQGHNESAWSKYFPQAYQWLVGFEAKPPEEKDFYRIYLDTSYSQWETPYIAMWIGGTNIVPMSAVEGEKYLFYYDLPKEQTEFLFRANDDLAQWGESASVNVTFRPSNENMVYVFDSQTGDGKYSGSWQQKPPKPEKDEYRVYFDVSNAGWSEAYICMWIGGENLVEMTPVEGKTGVFYYDLPKEQVEFLLRADLDFSHWGEYSSVNISFSPENENMVYVFDGQSGDGKQRGAWQEYK